MGPAKQGKALKGTWEKPEAQTRPCSAREGCPLDVPTRAGSSRSPDPPNACHFSSSLGFVPPPPVRAPLCSKPLATLKTCSPRRGNECSSISSE